MSRLNAVLREIRERRLASAESAINDLQSGSDSEEVDEDSYCSSDYCPSEESQENGSDDSTELTDTTAQDGQDLQPSINQEFNPPVGGNETSDIIDSIACENVGSNSGAASDWDDLLAQPWPENVMLEVSNFLLQCMYMSYYIMVKYVYSIY